MPHNAIPTLICLAVFGIGGASLYAQSSPSKETQAMTHSAIQAAIDTNNAAVAARDIDRILSTYEPDAALVVQPGLPVTGTAALRDGFGQFLALDPQLTVTDHEIIEAGDIALHLYPWTMAGTAPDGSAFQQTGLSVVVLRRQPDGRWLMVIDNPFGDRLLHRN